MAEEADFDFKSLGAKKAQKKYRVELIMNLEQALKKALQDADLEQANKIDAAITALKKGASLAGGSAANRKAQKEANRTTKKYWPNGQKTMEGYFNNDERDGHWTWWHDDGKKVQKIHYKDGKEVTRKNF